MKTHERILAYLKDNHRPGGYRVDDLALACGVSVSTARKAVIHLDDFRLVRISSNTYMPSYSRLRATYSISAK